MSIFCKMFGHHLEGVKIIIDTPVEEVTEMVDKINDRLNPVFCRRCKQVFASNKKDEK